MITSIFNKTRPFNYLLLGICYLLIAILFFLVKWNYLNSDYLSLKTAGFVVIIFSSTFLLDFIVSKNAITKDNNYALFFFLTFTLYFPSLYLKIPLLAANFFILIALRRLISLKTVAYSREKVFDACFWIFLASLFHFWSILFIILVFVSIIQHVNYDFKFWLIPIIAFFAIAILSVFVVLFFKYPLEEHVFKSMQISFDFTNFETKSQHIALAIFSSITLFFGYNIIAQLKSKPLNMKSTFYKLFFAFTIAIIVYVLSPIKSNAILVFTLAPLSIFAANYLEQVDNRWIKEIVPISVLIIGLVLFSYNLLP